MVEDLTNLAINDLAGRASVSQAEVSVVTTAPVEWRDTSLGCPQPGRVYAQVITQGFRIILEARGKSYEYHTDSSRVVLCQIQ